MTVEQQSSTADGAETVQLAFHPTQDQVTEAMRTWERVTPRGRRKRVLWPVAVLLCAIVIVLGAVNGAVLGTSVPLLAIAVGVWLLRFLLRRFAVRQVYKAKAGRGEHTITVDGQGVRVRSELNTARVPWSQVAGYAETDNLFVLAHKKMHEINSTPLPKSALPQQADINRLRELLDRHTTRLGGGRQG
ncbi:YcxB family protein [Streptomyces montanisoli]|uniref:YcxB family protein n=1 Tax=Streptomyces montanisoli TaxID=2798581 RepID=A0A940M817_9ACTN|nr:YcxB family protein [Streptomyces montanisoli]MBP0457919.1 YcxB family protein [Streptomyces montanisoli]